MEREQIKAVFIDRNIQEKNFGSVVFDSFEKGKAATKYLLSLGHKKIVFISGIAGVYDSDERLRGYCEALKEAGISWRSDYQLQGFFEEERTRASVQQFLLEQKTCPQHFWQGMILVRSEQSRRSTKPSGGCLMISA